VTIVAPVVDGGVQPLSDYRILDLALGVRNGLGNRSTFRVEIRLVLPDFLRRSIVRTENIFLRIGRKNIRDLSDILRAEPAQRSIAA
jgi:hypothetical protein